MEDAPNTNPDYSQEYSEEKYWAKLKKYALKAGAEIVEKSLGMYEALKDKDTPTWAKATIVGALGYFIAPIDAIPDLTPIVGFSDDLGAIAAAFAIVAGHVKEEHLQRARETMKRWFGKLGKQTEDGDPEPEPAPEAN